MFDGCVVLCGVGETFFVQRGSFEDGVVWILCAATFWRFGRGILKNGLCDGSQNGGGVDFGESCLGTEGGCGKRSEGDEGEGAHDGIGNKVTMREKMGRQDTG